MDLPYIQIQGRVPEGGRPTVDFQFTAGDSSVTEADVIAALVELLGASSGVVEVTSLRHYIAQSPA